MPVRSARHYQRQLFLAVGLTTALIWPAAQALAQTASTVITNTSLNNLQQQTGASNATVQAIQNSLATPAVKPEVTVPAAGGTVLGTNLLLKGIATPSSDIDILIQSSSPGVGPLTGKATSDQYGVWSYTLGPELAAGTYTVKVYAQSNGGTPVAADPISFTVQAAAAATGNSGNSLLQSVENQPFVIIILAIIFSGTFLVTMFIWAVVLYFRSVQRGRAAGRMETWENPELTTMSEGDWLKFVNGMEKMRKYFALTQHPRLAGAGAGGELAALSNFSGALDHVPRSTHTRRTRAAKVKK
jgi:hypothetical protein